LTGHGCHLVALAVLEELVDGGGGLRRKEGWKEVQRAGSREERTESRDWRIGLECRAERRGQRAEQGAGSRDQRAESREQGGERREQRAEQIAPAGFPNQGCSKRGLGSKTEGPPP
jgi:hypothetical protein